MKQSFYRKLAQLERMEVEARQAEQHCKVASGTEVMTSLLSRCGGERERGESRAEMLARAAGITTHELKNLLSGRCLYSA